DTSNGEFSRGATSTYVFVEPLHADNKVVGAIVLAQNSAYIDQAVRHVWTDNLLRLIAQIIIISFAIYALVRWVFLNPMQSIAEQIRLAGRGEVDPEDVEHPSIFGGLVGEITKLGASLRQARQVASEEARMRLEQLDSPWTGERLKEFIKGSLRGRPIY